VKTRAMKGSDRDTYLELVKEFPLVSIRCDEQLTDAQRFVDCLLKKDHLDSGEEEYLDALSDLIASYEDATCDFPAVSTSELLTHLMEAKGVRQADVARDANIPPSTICEIMSGTRRLAMSNIGRLARYFSVPPSVFFTKDGEDEK